MLVNIIDRRKNKYVFSHINAIIEPTKQDNRRRDAELIKDDDEVTSYEERADISIAKAIAWANSLSGNYTLYIYDLGGGI